MDNVRVLGKASKSPNNTKVKANECSCFRHTAYLVSRRRFKEGEWLDNKIYRWNVFEGLRKDVRGQEMAYGV
jgi:hypothetical protein